jgi:hypothetical protein
MRRLLAAFGHIFYNSFLADDSHYSSVVYDKYLFYINNIKESANGKTASVVA